MKFWIWVSWSQMKWFWKKFHLIWAVFLVKYLLWSSRWLQNRISGSCGRKKKSHIEILLEVRGMWNVWWWISCRMQWNIIEKTDRSISAAWKFHPNSRKWRRWNLSVGILESEWRRSSRNVCLNHLHRNIREAVQNLREQAWDCLFQGSWSRKWGELLLLKVKKA